MQTCSQTWYVIVQSTMLVCKYVHECARVSLCETKYENPFTNVQSCLPCEVISECVSCFTNMQCMVQRKVSECTYVDGLPTLRLVHQFLNMCKETQLFLTFTFALEFDIVIFISNTLKNILLQALSICTFELRMCQNYPQVRLRGCDFIWKFPPRFIFRTTLSMISQV